MTDRLIVQAIAHKRDGYWQWMDDTSARMRAWAEQSDAEYQIYRGKRDPHLHPCWNRVSLILEAMAEGYRKVVWIDADTLLVDPSVSIFDETDDDVPFQSVRLPRDSGEGFIENDGVLVVNNTPEAFEALRYIWRVRRRPMPGWQQGWYDQWIAEHPSHHLPLDPRFNWFNWTGGIPTTPMPTRDEAVIVAWHAWDGNRFDAMYAELDRIGLTPTS